MNTEINKICEEINKVSNNHSSNSLLLEMVTNVIANEEDFPSDFVEMCYDIHELDSFTAEDVDIAKENNLNTPESFFPSLLKIKEENIKFWQE